MIQRQRGQRNEALGIPGHYGHEVVDITCHGDPGSRKRIPKRGNGREREHNVSQAAWMDYEDFHYSIIIVFEWFRFAILTCAAILSAI